MEFNMNWDKLLRNCIAGLPLGFLLIISLLPALISDLLDVYLRWAFCTVENLENYIEGKN
jgi:hypothetical protein